MTPDRTWQTLRPNAEQKCSWNAGVITVIRPDAQRKFTARGKWNKWHCSKEGLAQWQTSLDCMTIDPSGLEEHNLYWWAVKESQMHNSARTQSVFMCPSITFSLFTEWSEFVWSWVRVLLGRLSAVSCGCVLWKLRGKVFIPLVFPSEAYLFMLQIVVSKGSLIGFCQCYAQPQLLINFWSA